MERVNSDRLTEFRSEKLLDEIFVALLASKSGSIWMAEVNATGGTDVISDHRYGTDSRGRNRLGRRALVVGAAGVGVGTALGLDPAEAIPRRSSARDSTSAGVRTESGLIRGVDAALTGVTVYKGIPFAASTAGPNRWRVPQPAPSWSGVRVADTFGDVCPQSLRSGDTSTMSEDCLNLNIWTAAESSRERRPVLVWIYGGGFTGGAGSAAQFDGAGLAKKGLVVVTFNYRTGMFGFMASPALSAESGHDASGNYGLLDQIAALRWVQRNIAAFGGDPRRVTVAGQSAGAGSVAFLLYSPLAEGLFQRAIAESGVRNPGDPEIACLPTSYRTAAYAESVGTDYAAKLGASTLAEMRALSVADLLTYNSASDPNITVPMYDFWGAPLWRPVLDGWVVPRTIAQTLAKGHLNDVPVLTGNNKDENGAAVGTTTTLADYRAAVETQYGAMAGEFLARYPATTDDEATTAFIESARDSARVSTWLWTSEWAAHAKSPVFNYFWNHAQPGSTGAGHGSEIPYVFDNLYASDVDWTDTDREIADTLSSYVVNFAAHGDPNGRGLPRWRRTTSGSARVMKLGDGFGAMAAADRAKVSFFERFYRSRDLW
ncbi:MAG: carboxylesterase family protein [Nocardioides sp.]|uniref:carboxylesterase/lipase family protein n=1 Tax=Nocardioides sp. TaxID=35761 RepID=UPI0039E57703